MWISTLNFLKYFQANFEIKIWLQNTAWDYLTVCVPGVDEPGDGVGGGVEDPGGEGDQAGPQAHAIIHSTSLNGRLKL